MRSARLAGLLRAAGVRHGDVLALVLENRAEFSVAAWAGMRCGLYVAPADPRLAAPELAASLQRAAPAALITSTKYAEAARGALGAQEPRILLTAGEDLDAAIDAAEPIDAADERLGTRMVFSSGTTGRPKAIRLPLPDAHPSQLNDRLAPLLSRFELDADTVLLSPAPLYHAAPFSFGLGAQAYGGTLVVSERFDAARTLEALQEHRATHVLLVPTMLRRLLRLPEEARAAADLSALRVAITGAAPCPPELKAEIRDWWGPVLHEYYGASEGYGQTHISPAEMAERPASVGRPLRGTIRVTGDDGAPLQPGEPGRVWFEGAGVEVEYAGDPEKTAATRGEREGWVTIGDRGWVDEEGYLFLTGREGEMIITGGINVEPEQVEGVLESLPALSDVAVLGAADDDLGQRIVALVVRGPQAPAGDDDLTRVVLEHAAAQLGRAKLPRAVLAVAEIPRTDTGKIARRRLAELYAQASGAVSRREEA